METETSQMVTVEELKGKYGTAEDRLLGTCVIIPLKELTSELEAALKTQGHRVIYRDFQGKNSAFVSLTKRENNSEIEKTVFESTSKEVVPLPPLPNTEVKAKAKGLPLGFRRTPENEWKPEEDKIIIDCWNKKLTVDRIIEEVHKQFPQRSSSAVKNRITRLQNRDKIKRRFKVKGTKPTEADGKRWLAKEEKKLIALWNAKPNLTVQEITNAMQQDYPNRTQKGIRGKIEELHTLGVIKSRYKKRGVKPTELTTEMPVAPEIPMSTSPQNTDTETMDSQKQDTAKENELELYQMEHYLDTQQRLELLMDKLDIQLVFEGLQIRETQGQIKIPDSLKRIYSDVMLTDSQEVRLAFRNKVALLQEAFA